MAVGVVLLIDDDAYFRKLVTVMLIMAGYDVQEATNGVGGLASYRKQRPDVVLMDILMPVMEGLETIQELRRVDPQAKIIAMSVSGNERYGHLNTAVQMGAIRTLHKPFTRVDLLAAVAEVIAA